MKKQMYISDETCGRPFHSISKQEPRKISVTPNVWMESLAQ